MQILILYVRPWHQFYYELGHGADSDFCTTDNGGDSDPAYAADSDPAHQATGKILILRIRTWPDPYIFPC